MYRDATVCFYRHATRPPGQPPIGLRDFAFCAGVYDDVVARWEVAGVLPRLAEVPFRELTDLHNSNPAPKAA